MSNSAITGPIFSDVRRSPSGSAAAPSWSFADSTGTGVYLASTDVLALSTAGVQRVVVDSAGNVGIGGAPTGQANFRTFELGATGVSGLIDVLQNGARQLRIYNSSNNAVISNSTSGGATAFITTDAGGVASERMSLNANGQLSVYAPTPESISKYAVLARSSSSVAYAGGIMVSQGSSLYGYQLVTTGGSTQNGSTLYFRSKRESDGAGDRYVGYAVGTGAWVQGNNSTAWSQTSDVRIKQNVRPVNNSLQKITELKPVHFEYVDKAEQIKTGFIAQEFEKVLPGHVHEVTCPEDIAAIKPELKDEKIKSIDADLIPYLVGAIKELKAELDEAKAKIAALESKP